MTEAAASFKDVYEELSKLVVKYDIVFVTNRRAQKNPANIVVIQRSSKDQSSSSFTTLKARKASSEAFVFRLGRYNHHTSG